MAKLAGVGVGTASRVISGRGSVSTEAAERVRAAIRELEFRPSSIARSLSGQSLGAIGLFVQTLRGDFYRSILEAVDDELRAVHRHMVVVSGSNHGSDYDESIRALDFLMQRDCDGIVIIGHQLHDADILRLRDRNPRLAILNRRLEGMEDACFSVDHHRAGALAARTLLDHGHRRFGVMGGPSSAPDNTDRVQGFLDTLAAEDIDAASVPVIESNFAKDGGLRTMGQLLQRDPSITGVFCGNDDMAVGALTWLRDHDISVPRDMSVIGYDDVYTSAHTFPALTSIHIPMYEVAANAVRWLIEQCYGVSQPIERQFPVTVSMRDSVAMAPAQPRKPLRDTRYSASRPKL
ncbi:LacI family DNA-binding transcriptional regulator [Pararobbsia silviterrae]|uniref:LacI family DNA-binding transcriptional regulator n=1 Tax=Pararobbsia silviterrae TaxID=1792498 RepID=UPI001F0BDA4B|nr:substrate-binding domain-containing protein [Pararobbsia silviterrae]